jgi:hypothetical protein
MVPYAPYATCKFHYYYLDLPKYYFKTHELDCFRRKLY